MISQLIAVFHHLMTLVYFYKVSFTEVIIFLITYLFYLCIYLLRKQFIYYINVSKEPYYLLYEECFQLFASVLSVLEVNIF